MAKLLLEHGANPNTAPESSGSALMHTRKDPELRQLLLEFGADEETDKQSELQRLIQDNELEELEAQLRDREALGERAEMFWNEGILAGPSNNGNAEMVKLLMRFGARVPSCSKWGRYYYFKHAEIAGILLKGAMEPNHKNWHSVTMLHDMAHEGSAEKIELLLDHGADIDAIDEEYRSTPLGIACRWGKLDVVNLLLDNGADPNRAGAPWATPLAWARKKGHVEIEQRLRMARARG
jgi:ankyrin repeat protein